MPRSAPPDPRHLLPLHPLELRILLALLDGPAHGYRIVKRVEAEEAGWSRILPANLYRRLRDLDGRGLVEEASAPPTGDSRRRRYFQLTALGREAARLEAQRLAELVRTARERRLLPRTEGSR